MTCRRLLRAAQSAARHPPTVDTLAKHGVDVHAIIADGVQAPPDDPPLQPLRGWPAPDGEGDEPPLRRDYRNFIRDRS